MPRLKKTSRTLERIELRVAGLQAIDPLMNFGDDRDLRNITQLIEQLRNKISAYNTALSVIDSSKAEIHTLETTLNDLAEKMLIGVAFKYGKDSSEYEMAGGVKKSDRIRRSTASRLKAKAEEVSATAL
ncbi:MAG: hypothetical protein KME13_02545 [Myxacorys californica WJT36-NPBG1]|jgi:hypothetical protein|nr:hypothetical protein [Myxacorys californica WJT36-NPBG1]